MIVTRWGRAIRTAGAALLLAGCASAADVISTSPSATSQLLVFRALERAVADLDLTRLRGRRVALEVISQLGELSLEKEPKFAAAYLETWLRAKGVRLIGGDVDEAPQAYRRLPDVLAQHAGTIRIEHRLRPFAVMMAGSDVFDPFKD